MKLHILLIAAVTGGFALLTLRAVDAVGYLGIFAAGLDNWGAAQIFADLVILAVLAMAWIITDARAHGLNPWPFVLATAVAGSFGPLTYLLWRERRSRDGIRVGAGRA